ncbi:hypothetical protein QFZ76_003951 [Streptomyces sp. V4I2]|nr:hypothetical protein [Streptomyces sp. V4I2]
MDRKFAEARGRRARNGAVVVRRAEGVGEVGGDSRDLEAGVRVPEGVLEGASLHLTGLLVRPAGAGGEPADGRIAEVAVGSGLVRTAQRAVAV